MRILTLQILIFYTSFALAQVNGPYRFEFDFNFGPELLGNCKTTLDQTPDRLPEANFFVIPRFSSSMLGNSYLSCSIDLKKHIEYEFQRQAKAKGIRIDNPSFVIRWSEAYDDDLATLISVDPFSGNLHFFLEASTLSSLRAIMGLIKAQLELGTVSPLLYLEVDVFEGI